MAGQTSGTSSWETLWQRVGLGRLIRGSDVLREYGVVVGFAVLFVALWIGSPAFVTKENWLNILDEQAPLGIMACAGTFVIIAGGFDLSVAGILAVSGIAAAKIAYAGHVELGFVVGILAGVGFGTINGFIVSALRINAFIATLATSIAYGGVALVLTGGIQVVVSNPTFTVLGQGRWFTIRITIFVLAGFAILLGFILARSVYGRYVYAVGGNAEAARLSGVPVGLIKGSTFALSGLSAGIAGVLEASRLSTGSAISLAGIELPVITAVVLGGTSILGGEGAVWRSILGVFLLAIITNGFNLLNINPTYQQIAQGAIIVVAVGLDVWTRKRT